MMPNPTQTTSVLVGVLVLCVAMLSGSIARAVPRYPTRAGIASTLLVLDRQSSEKRLRSMTKLLDRLRFTESVADDKVMLFAFDKIVLKFQEKQYTEILGALDATPLDGGFAAALCVAYARMSDVPVFRIWYRERAESIRRCVGESFNENDIAKLTSDEEGSPAVVLAGDLRGAPSQLNPRSVRPTSREPRSTHPSRIKSGSSAVMGAR